MHIPSIAELKLIIDSTTHQYCATQTRLSYPIVRRLFLKMKMGIRFQPIRVAEDLIIDGHHRYIAAILAKQEVTVTPSSSTSTTTCVLWTAVELDPLDWDSRSQIDIFNTLDAANSNVDPQWLQKLIE